MHPGSFHPVLDHMASSTFDHARGDGVAGGEVPIIVNPVAVAVEIVVNLLQAGRMRGDQILNRLAPESLAWFITQAPQEALALQPLFAEPDIAHHFAPERAILEKAALSLASTGSA